MTMSSDDILAGLLNECSNELRAGATVDACLERYPQHAAALEPLIGTLAQVRALRDVPARSAEAAAATRSQFMSAATRLSEQRKLAPAAWNERLAAWWRGFIAPFGPSAGGWSMPRSMPAGLLAALLVVLLAGVLVTGGVSASAKTLPGDLLYPIKTTAEQVRLLITRDPAARTALTEAFIERRLDEAKAVMLQHCRVPSMALEGTIEAISSDQWTVSGLTIALDADSRILGTPALGARVHGLVRAPGDGQLIVIYVEVDPAAPNPAPVESPAQTSATPTRLAPTATADVAAAATALASPTDTDAALRLPRQPWVEPDDWPTAESAGTPTATAVATPTRTPRPTVTTTVTRIATHTPPADLPPARPEIKVSIIGWVTRIEGSRWTIDGVTVNVGGATQISGNPGVGWKVSVLARVEADGSLTALRIAALAPPEAPPEPVEFTDILREINGEWWTIGSTSVRIRGDTAIEGDPQIGDLVEMKGERRLGEIWALRIRTVRLTEVEFEGIISAVSGDSLVVGGHTVLINAQTQIIGTPEVGRVAQVAAVQMPDGRLIGRVIMVLEPEPTRTPTATQGPTSTPTSTPEPSSTPTEEPTSTSTPEPSPTPTEEPTSTSTPEPSPTPTEEPTPTLTPEPTATLTEEPTPTSSPAPQARAVLPSRRWRRT